VAKLSLLLCYLRDGEKNLPSITFKIYAEFNKKYACTNETAARNLCNERLGVEMARAANGPNLGGPLRLYERAADNIFSGWILPSCYEPTANVEKNFTIFFSSKNQSVAIKVSETTWHLLRIYFPVLHFQANFFPI